MNEFAKTIVEWMQFGAVIGGGAFVVIRGIAYMARLHGRYEDTEKRVNGHASILDEHKSRLGWIEGHLGKEDV